MAISLLIIGIDFVSVEIQQIFLLIYVAAFQMSLGTVAWIYLGETQNPKTMGLVTALSRFWMILIVLFFPLINNSLHANTFLIFSVFMLIVRRIIYGTLY